MFDSHKNLLFFVVGHGYAFNYYTLKELADTVYKQHAAGLVFYLGKYIERVPDDIIEYCDSLDLPVIVLPWEISHVTVNMELCQQLIEKSLLEKETHDLIHKLLFEDITDKETLLKLAQQTNLNSNLSYFSYVVSIDGYDEIVACTDPEIVEDIQSKLKQLIKTNGDLGHYSDLDVQKNGEYILIIKDVDKSGFLKTQKNRHTLIKTIARQINKHIAAKKYPVNPITLTVGVGGSYQDLFDIKTSYQEAQKVIMARRRELLVNDCICYDDLGVYKLLFLFDNNQLLGATYPDKLKKVLAYDKAHDSTLIPTLEKYLENKGSLALAAEAMHIHKNTVTYRLNKVKSLVDVDINKPKNIPILLLEIKAIKFLAADD